MATKGNIYLDKNYLGDQSMLNQLKEAVIELEENMKASVPIVRGGCRVGWGVNKAQRGIAVDSVISIARAIKALKGWS